MPELRNIAIIAHVDHGKTTLVDRLLSQTGTVEARQVSERMLDSNDLERERGITILAKNTAITWRGTRINIVDTPGHADFGGEVERVLSMVDSVLLLVDAVDGPMPQTRFVTQKAFAAGLAPIVVINKVDRPGAEPYRVLDQVFDLFDRLGANDHQLDFPVIYTSALLGRAGIDAEALGDDMTALLELIVARVPPPPIRDGAFQMRISALDYSSYVGVIGIGRIERGTVSANSPITVLSADGSQRSARVLQILGHHGLTRVAVPSASAGDIVCVVGVDDVAISDTLCDPLCVEPLPRLGVDEPTLSVVFHVNDSPFAGRDGRFLTSRQLGERLEREASHNVALNVVRNADTDRFLVSGRGELHLAVLIETMRREGYEMAVARPQVIEHEVDGERHEPFEELLLDIEDQHQGAVMQELGRRRADLLDMRPDGQGRVRLTYRLPARALMGFRTLFLSLTSGTGVLNHSFAGYRPFVRGVPSTRNHGVLIANTAGTAVAYALFNLQQRGRMCVGPGEAVYEGMIVGLNSRDNDLTVNPMKGKKLTNIRAAGSDENVLLTPAVRFTLEAALEFIDEDELVEVTPVAIRLRKKLLTENARKRGDRARA